MAVAAVTRKWTIALVRCIGGCLWVSGLLGVAGSHDNYRGLCGERKRKKLNGCQYFIRKTGLSSGLV